LILPVFKRLGTHPLLRLTVAAGLLLGIANWLVPPAQLLAAFTSLHSSWLLLAASLGLLGLVVQWWKWRRLVHDGLPAISESEILRSLFVGFGLGMLTPGRLGELGRGLGWPGGRIRATTLTAADRHISSLVTLTIAAGCALYFVSSAWRLACVGLILAIVGIASFASVRRRFGRSLTERLLRRLGVSPNLGVTRAGWRSNASAAVLFNLIFLLQMLCILRASGPVASETAIAIPIMFALKALLPISFMDLGVREGAAIAVLGPLGVSAVIAVQSSLLLFTMNVLLPGVAGLLVLARGTNHPSLTNSNPRVEFAHVRC
jgi:hypothetical protein